MLESMPRYLEARTYTGPYLTSAQRCIHVDGTAVLLCTAKSPDFIKWTYNSVRTIKFIARVRRNLSISHRHCREAHPKQIIRLCSKILPSEEITSVALSDNASAFLSLYLFPLFCCNSIIMSLSFVVLWYTCIITCVPVFFVYYVTAPAYDSRPSDL